MSEQPPLELDPLQALLNPVHMARTRDLVAAVFCIHRQGTSTLFGPAETDMEGAYRDADRLLKYGREHPPR